MSQLNKDTLVAIFLLLFCGVFFAASFDIRETIYGTLGSEVWPRVILTLLSLLSLGYLVQSVRQGKVEGERQKPGFKTWLLTYRNALWCFFWFALFLLTLPYLGMLIGGSLFVYATLATLGERSLHAQALHLAVAVVSVGLMWALFTYGLNVFLPEGELLSIH
ncbi:MAG: tripartite tricarboxylate transporter TctB family protein [Acidiferrobacterales bacterium]